MNFSRTLGVLLAGGLFATLSAGCSQLECGEGTIEQDDLCVTEPALDPDTGTPSFCGEDTVWNVATGRCELIANGGVCGPNTSLIVDEMTGLPTCVGTGGGANSCDPYTCPSPAADRISVCGRIHDVGTSTPIGAMGMEFDPSRLSLKVYEPIGFVSSTPGNRPDPVAEGVLNACGYYQVTDIPAQATGVLAIGIDDAGATDDFVLTGIAFAAGAGERITNRPAWLAANTLDATWTTEAGNPFSGQSFAEKGVWMPIYIDTNAPAVGPFQGTPVSGVTITGAGGASQFYFADTDPLTHSMPRPMATQASTGVNGAGLLTDVGLGTFAGSKAGCTFTGAQGAAVTGVLVVHVFDGTCN